jgi:hypothetical protein
MKKIIFLLIFCLVFSLVSFGQTKEITRKAYYEVFYESLEKVKDISRRSIASVENHKDGKLDSTEEYVDEYIKSDIRRYFHSEKLTNKNRKIELIQIGKDYYCRRDDGDWKKSTNWCADGSAFGLSNIISERFTVEPIIVKGEDLNLFENYTTYKNTYSPNKDKEGLSYFQRKFWLNKDGLILKEEIINGLIEPKRLYWQQTKTYEYNPKNLKIEAPIK